MAKSKKLQKEFNYFLEHHEELVKKFTGRFIVIKGQKVIGDYSSEQEAYITTTKSHELGTFLIQFCSPDKESYQQTFHSRVVFA